MAVDVPANSASWVDDSGWSQMRHWLVGSHTGTQEKKNADYIRTLHF